MQFIWRYFNSQERYRRVQETFFDCLRQLDEESLRLKLRIFQSTNLEVDCFVKKISQTGILPFENRKSAILSVEASKTLKKHRSFRGSVHYIAEIIPDPSQKSNTLRPLIRKSFVWTAAHENSFVEMKKGLANATENCQYNQSPENRVKCDAFPVGLGAASEQLKVDGWSVYTSSFPNSCEKSYRVIELELVGVVWSIEYSKNYFFGQQLKVITDQRAQLSILKKNRCY